MNVLVRSAALPARRFLAAFVAAFALVALALPLPADARAAPESFADLAERVTARSSTSRPRRRSRPAAARCRSCRPARRSRICSRSSSTGAARANSGQGDNAPRQQQRRSNSLGSGFVVDPSGIVITNNHVIGDANDISVIFSDGTRLKAEIIGKDPKVDLAVLR